MDFNEFCELMNSAISSKEFSEVNDCLQDKDMCFNSNPEDIKDMGKCFNSYPEDNKEKIVRDWIWNNMEIPAQTKIFLLLKLLGRDMNSYIRPNINGTISWTDSHCLLHYVIKDYDKKFGYPKIFEERSIEDFEKIARFLRHEIFFEYEEGMTPFTLAYLQRNHDCFNVSRF